MHIKQQTIQSYQFLYSALKKKKKLSVVDMSLKIQMILDNHLTIVTVTCWLFEMTSENT